MEVLGIDIGGSGIKGAVVNTETGELLTERLRIPTPEGAKPADVAAVVRELVQRLSYQGPVGYGFPAVVQKGFTLSAANVSKDWIGTNAVQLFGNATGLPVHVLNDADAAGLAEMKFGAGREHMTGVVMILTFGTGIGSAVFVEGRLFPNTEFGHLEIRGKDAEHRASAAVKTSKDLNYKDWAERVQEYLSKVEALMSPDVIIVGGGVSKDHDKFFKYLKVRAQLMPAQFRNQAGIVGAALYAASGGSTSVL